MSKQFFTQNTFSNNVGNDARMGAFYTDPKHCERIGRLFKWPKKEVCVLEPAIGDGVAVDFVTKNLVEKKIFAVELNKETYEKVKNKYEYVLNADFLTGVKISHKSFSFVFSNPPYGVLENNGTLRKETAFLEKLYPYMKTNGILVYVISYPTLTNLHFLQKFMARFIPIATFRFDDDIYQHFKQIVVIAMKREQIGYMKHWLQDYSSSIDTLEKLPYLPTLEDEISTPIPVPESYEKEILYFTTLEFDTKSARTSLEKNILYNEMEHMITVPSYKATELGRPAIPLPKDLLYLCAVSGGGQGLVGSIENNDFHLQRGVVKIIKDNVVQKGEKGGTVLLETSKSKVSINLIEQDQDNHCVIRVLE